MGFREPQTPGIDFGGSSTILQLGETTAPSATANYGKLYVKSSDSLLYFLDDSGNEYSITSGGSGATTALSNLASVAINATLIPGTAGAIDLGSATKPWGLIYFAGTSGTPGTNNFKITGASTSGTRTITAPDSDTKLAISAQVLTFAGPTAARTITFPDAAITVARTDAANTFTGHQTIEGVTSTGATGTGKLVFDGTPTLVTPLLGTPTSGTLTNCTGLPIAGLVASTSTAIGVGSVELGHASDTTIARVSAGVVSIEGVNIATVSSTDTLTNKRVTKRSGTTASSATPTINTDNVDIYTLSAQTTDITSFTTNLSGTPTVGQTLWIAITGTAARAITWGASFEASGNVALPTTTVTTARLDVGFIWNDATTKWRCVAVA